MKFECGSAANPSERERSTMSGMGNIKNVVADKLHDVAMTISRKTTSPGTRPEVSQYGREASKMLEQSADYIRDLDYSKAEAAVREYVETNPGRSLLIAGLTGLVLGAIFRRR